MCIGKIDCSVSYFSGFWSSIFMVVHELGKISTEHMEGLILIGNMASLAGETDTLSCNEKLHLGSYMFDS